jgi:hypothetical protein
MRRAPGKARCTGCARGPPSQAGGRRPGSARAGVAGTTCSTTNGISKRPGGGARGRGWMTESMNTGPSDVSCRRVTASRVGYILIVLGLAIALFAMAIEEWTELRELELISGCIALTTSVIAAIMMACDLSTPTVIASPSIRRLYRSTTRPTRARHWSDCIRSRCHRSSPCVRVSRRA